MEGEFVIVAENPIESEDAKIMKKFPAISMTLDEIRRLYDWKMEGAQV